MVDVVDLDVQVSLVNDDNKPSVNFESRWHDLVLQLEEQKAINEDFEARIAALENP